MQARTLPPEARSMPRHTRPTQYDSIHGMHTLERRLTNLQGPVAADNLPTPESKEDLKKRAEELNK
jgi:hypothetical protein